MSRYTSDQDLAAGLHAGRDDAFARLYSDQRAAIYNLCARILGDREEAEDVTHDTFVAAFSNPPAATAEVRLRPWLYRVATNACFNRLRARKHAGGDGETIAAVPDGVDEYQRAETVALVEASLAELNERYRTALVLKDLHGLPPAEIAEVMEVSRANADVLVHRARGAFKVAFAQLGGTSPAPVNLGLVLAPLSVPAALHALPPLPHPVAPVHSLPHHLVPPAAGPAGTGLLGKIGASMTAKVAIGAAATTVVLGGGVAAVRHARHRSTAEAATREAATPQAAKAAFVDQPVHLLKTRWGCFEWSTQHDLDEIEHWCADRAAADRHSEAVHDDGEGTSHDAMDAATHTSDRRSAATSDSRASADGGSTAQATHGSSSGDTTPHGSGGGRDSDATHDAGGDSSTHDARHAQ